MGLNEAMTYMQYLAAAIGVGIVAVCFWPYFKERARKRHKEESEFWKDQY